ncbi:MAG: dihydrofolate reductase family protein [Promethearchaeota archaeon]
MRDLILYIATSLDGYIAGKSGEIDWLFYDQDYGYKDFIQDVDTVIMGRRTYQQILKFGDYPYNTYQSFVFSRTLKEPVDDNIKIISTDLVNFILDLKAKEGKNIWLIGGSKIIEPLIQNGLIDKYIISIHPLILGDGILLFSMKSKQINLKLEKCESFDSGLVQLTYRKK